ncbi:MAG: NADH-quinone oxidoreductase subunit NuoH [Chloroflexota bacterium]|nr:NADH-quinone oxidoreductase subunit NuoH [Chloroflexota bacterium]
MDICTHLLATFEPCLIQFGIDPPLAQGIALMLNVLLVLLAPLIMALTAIYVERKLSARIQDRVGPNRVGPYGTMQNFADVIKLITKEDIIPDGADRFLFRFAPVLTFTSVLLIWANVPLTPLHLGAALSIGVPYFLAVSSLGTLGIMIAGWSSNNKYGLLGALRSVALLVSYEIPLVFALIVPVLLAGTLSLQGIVEAQAGVWYIVIAPVAALIFFVSNLAETGRPPFDLIEAESEIVAGYNVEYSGMRFGLFMGAEFLHFLTVNVVFAVIFLGGWHGPGVQEYPVLGVVYLFGKAALSYFVAIWVRFTVPRLRIDQIMNLNWKFLVPLSVVNLAVTAVLLKLTQPAGTHATADLGANLPQTLVLLVGNLLIIGVVLSRLQRVGRHVRRTMDIEAIVPVQ